MNKIPFTLWKEVVGAKKDRAIRTTCKELGKYHGPEEPYWSLENNVSEKHPMGTFQFSHRKSVKPDQFERSFFCSAFWPKNKSKSQQASITLYEGAQRFCEIFFLDLNALNMSPGPELWQKLSLCPKVSIRCQGAPQNQVFSQGQMKFFNFSSLQMERIIRVYQACSPVTFWFIEEMARFLSEWGLKDEIEIKHI